MRRLLSAVTELRALDVKPLYNVWDELLDPPDRVSQEDRSVGLTWLPQGRLHGGRVRVPWRGG